MTKVEDTLKERGSEYGNYLQQARLSQRLLSDMRMSQSWCLAADDQKDALQMIAVKISRILTGNPNNLDNWHDIQGYARLVEDRLRKENES